MALYLLLGGRYSSGDTVPTSLAALNLLQHGTVYFDNFRNSYLSQGQAYYFTESLRGHWVSIYPIGASILTFPIYLVLYLGLLLWGPRLDITDPGFEPLRLLFQSVAAAMVTALSAIVFYQACRLKFSRRVALLSTITFAFATSTWSISARALWQHGPANLVLITGLYLLLRAARRSASRSLSMHLFLAGLCFGFLPSVRPTSALFTIAVLAYVVYYYRLRTLSFIAGFIAYLPALVWNVYHFGKLSGGYGNVFGQAPYVLTLSHFITTALGHLISPSRGLLIISPILLFSIVGFINLLKSNNESNQERWLIYTLLLGAAGILIQYSFYTVWWGGHSIGPRFMTDILIPLCYLINYVSTGSTSRKLNLSACRRLFNSFFYSLLIFSLLVQLVFVLTPSGNMWNLIPVNVDIYPYRVWHLQDSQVMRCFRSMAIPLGIRKRPSSEYLTHLRGTIDQVTVIPYSPKINPFKELQGFQQNKNFQHGESIYVRSRLVNKGDREWYGVHSALLNGETRVRVQLFRQGKMQSEDRLFVLADGVSPGMETTAVGLVKLPDSPGQYQLKLDLVLDGIGDFPELDGSIGKINLLVGDLSN